MNKNIEKEEFVQELTLQRVNEILSKPNEDFLSNENIIKDILRIIFTNDGKFTQIVFPTIQKQKENEFHLINKIVELINYIFNMPKEKRKAIYSVGISSIGNDKINKIIKQIAKKIKDIECIKFDSKNIDNLYTIIYKFFEKQEKTLSELIYIVFIKIGYINHSRKLLSYILFCILKKKYLSNEKIEEIYFKDCLLNLDDDVCIQLIIDILNGKINNNLMIYSCVVLQFDKVKNYFKEYDLISLESVSEKVQLIIRKYSKIDIYDITSIFIQEYTNLLSVKLINYIYANKNIENKEKNNILENKKNKEKKEDHNKSKKLNPFKSDIIKEKNNNIYWGKINKIINNLKMDSEQYSQLKDIFETLINKISKLESNENESQKTILALTNYSDKMKNDSDKLKKDMEQMKKDMDKMKNDMERMKNESDITKKDMERMKNESDITKKDMERMKNVICKMKLREEAKRFLDSFLLLLSLEEQFYNFNSEKKYELIFTRIKKKYKKFENTKKYKVLTNLINRSINLLTYDNHFIYELIDNKYQKDFFEYSKKRNSLNIKSQFINYLKVISIEDEFDESYSFLDRYYYYDFNIKEIEIDILDDYFKKL